MQDSRAEFSEPFFTERIEKQKAKAKQIITGQVDNESDLLVLFKFFLSRKYGIGIYDDYFLERTLDELAFEYFLWREYEEMSDPEVKQEQAASSVAKAMEEVVQQGASIFPDGDWGDVQLDGDFIKKAREDFAGRKE